MSTSQALSHPFLLPSAPWTHTISGDETVAMSELRSRIQEEIVMTLLPE